ncbi:hypothetical protein HFO98_27340 [Rhizobium leguminosarum]|uniref:hypothetical protein n=1 Tax=Rhizobium leguminosarum TaxID=384 RepID=UPI001C977450|nr:hypothetical protein [Rhizobium leguminosarum]MBY5412101.1 hypothetical protein [Rhizobium leguminosarum]
MQMGTQVEPHYHGRLFAVLHNITSEDVEILRKNGNDGHKERDRLFTIEFFKIGRTAPGQSADLPIDRIPDFAKGTSFAKSAINLMFEKSKSFEIDLLNLKSSVEATVDDIKNRLQQDAHRVLDSAQVQIDATKSITELSERHRKDTFDHLEQKFDERINNVTAVEARISAEIDGLKKSSSDLWKSMLLGVVVVVFASALIPYFISFAVSKTVPSFDTMLNPLRDDVSSLKRQVDGVSGKIDEDAMIRSFQATIMAQQQQIEALVKRLDALQTQPTNDQAPAGNGTNPGQAR